MSLVQFDEASLARVVRSVLATEKMSLSQQRGRRNTRTSQILTEAAAGSKVEVYGMRGTSNQVLTANFDIELEFGAESPTNFVQKDDMLSLDLAQNAVVTNTDCFVVAWGSCALEGDDTGLTGTQVEHVGLSGLHLRYDNGVHLNNGVISEPTPVELYASGTGGGEAYRGFGSCMGIWNCKQFGLITMQANVGALDAINAIDRSVVVLAFDSGV